MDAEYFTTCNGGFRRIRRRLAPRQGSAHHLPKIDAAMSSLPEMYAMFPMIARHARPSEAAGRIARRRPQALLLHLWYGSTLRRSRGRTAFAGALAHSRMGATRPPSHPPKKRNTRQSTTRCLEKSDGFGRVGIVLVKWTAVPSDRVEFQPKR